MPLDLSDTAVQIDRMAADLKARLSDRRSRLRNALAALRSFDVSTYEAMRQQSEGSHGLPLPSVAQSPDAVCAPPPLPENFTVAAVDGSHVDMDRHTAVRCFLINVGVTTLTYGSRPSAELFSRPRLYAQDDELVMQDDASGQRQPVEGAVLGAKRAVDEARALVGVVRGLPPHIPALALLDGSLTTIGLIGRLFPDFVLRELLTQGYAAALRQLGQMAEGRRLAVASYISLPRSTEVVEALKPASCEYGVEYALRFCGPSAARREPCRSCVGGTLDRELFAQTLGAGQRSALFGSTSATVEKYYQGLGIHFFYVHTGEEIGRVEVPSWVAESEELLGLTHALIVDQCAKGQGYPVALMESHEQAVITAADRRHFQQLVERALEDRRLPVYTSEKSLSKSVRWL